MLHNGGLFEGFPRRKHKKGKISYVDLVDSDKFPVHEDNMFLDHRIDMEHFKAVVDMEETNGSDNDMKYGEMDVELDMEGSKIMDEEVDH
ncbi:hypothetical protein QVD17_18847 [Tagetes erecta]|uniref:Uncharacterized protein n=1 Tax=Tagetes erecta TaxID=13708 RepID=A0AAD8NW16_TARER|nr:hypothetical protein QVD17_18847 [Tagetes erecta]